jgi:hypothetical protein
LARTKSKAARRGKTVNGAESMSAFERAGVAYLAGSRKSLKIVIDGKDYFVHVKDISSFGQSQVSGACPLASETYQRRSYKPQKIELSYLVILK